MPRRQSGSDIIGSQVERSLGKKSRADVDVEELEAPLMDDFDVDEDVDLRQNAGKKKRRGEKKLTFKASLDDSFSKGKYAATAVDAEAAMDDIFGALDGDIEDEVGAAKFKTQEQYEEWFEQNKDTLVKKDPLAGVDERDIDVVKQLEDLRKRQQGTRTDMTFTSAISTQLKDADQQAKDSVSAFSDLVQFRWRLQPAVVNAVRFPQGEMLGHFAKSDQNIDKALQAARLTLRSNIGSMFAISSETERGLGRLNLTDLWRQINLHHVSMMKNTDEVVRDWASKAVASVQTVAQQKKAAKQGTDLSTLETINRSLMDQIKGVLEGGKLRILDRSRRNRMHSVVLGKKDHFEESKEAKALRIADGDMDSEIFDDADFVRELVHRGNSAAAAQLAAKGKDSDENAALSLGLHDKSDSSRVGLHRLTKGKAVSTEPRSKLVGFMAPVAYAEEGNHDALVSSLFQ